MVSSKMLIAILGIAVFLVAGGGSLVKPAFAQARADLSSVRTGISESVKNIRTKTQDGMNGDSVG